METCEPNEEFIKVLVPQAAITCSKQTREKLV